VKAIVFTKYGLPDVLELKEVEKPAPRDDEVLVRVHAASVNDWDWGLLRGKPFVNRLLFGLLKPRIKILGVDIAGRVEAIGGNVKQFRPGDEVFGDISGCGWGGFAEYVCVPEGALVRKSAKLTFDQAAAVPQAAVLALLGLCDVGQIHDGQKVLINGAGGGVGTFAIQIAKLYGVEVTGVDSAGKLDLVRSMGADHVIDYAREDFTKGGRCYDLILDAKTNRSVFDYARVLTPNGVYATVGGSIARLFQVRFLAQWIAMISKKNLRLVILEPNKHLSYLNELFEAGKVEPVIDRRYPLSGVAEALRYFGEGNHKGKIVISVEQSK
jgi:NADPH:quinone reductase-like Zn-dependent oxidoreductase